MKKRLVLRTIMIMLFVSAFDARRDDKSVTQTMSCLITLIYLLSPTYPSGFVIFGPVPSTINGLPTPL